MVKVVPFKAYRPPPTIAASLAAPPYDVINSDEARKMADGNEYSFLRVRAWMICALIAWRVRRWMSLPRCCWPLIRLLLGPSLPFLAPLGKQARDRPACQHLLLRLARLRAGRQVSRRAASICVALVGGAVRRAPIGNVSRTYAHSSQHITPTLQEPAGVYRAGLAGQR
jgi:hypothetical protein